MIIKVTQEHIDEGIRCSSFKCPVALAILTTDLIKAPNIVSVGIFGAQEIKRHGFPGRSWKFPKGEDIAYKIRFYDESGKMKPFEFEMVSA